MSSIRWTSGIDADRLKSDCLRAVKQWPGCETVSEVVVIRGVRGRFNLAVVNYGVAQKKFADRAVRAFQNEVRRHHHLIAEQPRGSEPLAAGRLADSSGSG